MVGVCSTREVVVEEHLGMVGGEAREGRGIGRDALCVGIRRGEVNKRTGDRSRTNDFRGLELVSIQVQRAAARDFNRPEAAHVAVRSERAVLHDAPVRREVVTGRRLHRNVARKEHRSGRRGESVSDHVAGGVRTRPVRGIRRIAVVSQTGPPRELGVIADESIE